MCKDKISCFQAYRGTEALRLTPALATFNLVTGAPICDAYPIKIFS